MLVHRINSCHKHLDYQFSGFHNHTNPSGWLGKRRKQQMAQRSVSHAFHCYLNANISWSTSLYVFLFHYSHNCAINQRIRTHGILKWRRDLTLYSRLTVLPSVVSKHSDGGGSYNALNTDPDPYVPAVQTFLKKQTSWLYSNVFCL
jgi:hypothetical protein